MTDYPLDHFIADLEFVLAAAQSEEELLEGVASVAERFAATPDWLTPEHYQCDEAVGYGEVLLYQAPDGGLNVWTGAWLPGGNVPPHDHGTWAVVAGMVGQERNVLWQRLDDGTQPDRAELESGEPQVIGPGDVLAMTSDAIHSVSNDGENVSVSLHVYGRDLAAGNRRQYDPEAGTATPIGRSLE
jgi:predicted metal-dependent enzyme (double-stranded beta helix superfamily)